MDDVDPTENDTRYTSTDVAFPAFNPDKALDEMTSFLVSGVRTSQRYADFAYTVRELSNHIAAGKPLPRRWAQMQAMTIKLWNPRGLCGEYQVTLNQESHAGIQPSNWMTVSPGPAIPDDDQVELPHSADLVVLIQRALEADDLPTLRLGFADLMGDDS